MLKKIFSKRYNRDRKLIQKLVQEPGNQLQLCNAEVDLIAAYLLQSEVVMGVKESLKTFYIVSPLFVLTACVWWSGSIVLEEIAPPLKIVLQSALLILVTIMFLLNTLLLILKESSNEFGILTLMFPEINSFEEEYEAFKEVLPLTELVEKLSLRKTESL